MPGLYLRCRFARHLLIGGIRGAETLRAQNADPRRQALLFSAVLPAGGKTIAPSANASSVIAAIAHTLFQRSLPSMRPAPSFCAHGSLVNELGSTFSKLRRTGARANEAVALIIRPWMCPTRRDNDGSNPRCMARNPGGLRPAAYGAEKTLPHSRQRALKRGVISPQNGHILCNPYPAISGLRLRNLRANRITNSATSRLPEMRIALIRALGFQKS